ncbi:MAG: hypothetical protein LUC24_04370 [Bacteroidales bacterium]|nr:hypothetical protein [Bacteroidales bacterium]
MDFKTNFSYDFLPEEGGSVFKDKPLNQRKPAQTKARKPVPRAKAGPEAKEERKFDAKKMIIYSEIMNPKFKE